MNFVLLCQLEIFYFLVPYRNKLEQAKEGKGRSIVGNIHIALAASHYQVCKRATGGTKSGIHRVDEPKRAGRVPECRP